VGVFAIDGTWLDYQNAPRPEKEFSTTSFASFFGLYGFSKMTWKWVLMDVFLSKVEKEFFNGCA